ncbi:MAG: SRPBCC family protein [Pyrinomonadaceae bacterium]
MTEFFIDPDIRTAKTLPSSFYTDERFFELSKEKIFARSWQFAGRLDEFASLKPVTLLPGILDEPILLSKTDDGVNCLSNVCTHRGKILVEEPCAANLIRCDYHGRRFDLGGKFLSMPEFADVQNFPTEEDDLKRIPFATRGGFGFVSVDPYAPFDEFVDDAAERVGHVERTGLKLVSSRDYEVNAHWALYCENYLEGFHIPFVHHSLNEVVDYGTYATETFRFSSLQTCFDGSGEIAARYLFIFPNLMFNFYPWGISVNVVRPVSPSRSIVEFLTYVSDESKLGSGAGADLDRVELEDEAVVESVQRGIRSRFYSHGRYSPTREQGTHHFHRLIAEFMRA